MFSEDEFVFFIFILGFSLFTRLIFLIILLGLTTSRLLTRTPSFDSCCGWDSNIDTLLLFSLLLMISLDFLC